MPRPSLIRIGVVTCIATDDLTGSDTLVAQIGGDRVFIGDFVAGDSRDVGVEASIAPGVTKLTILVEDLTGNDELITIDLTQDMDVDRTVGVRVGDARYDISFKVISEPDS
jgi:tetrahydromethanopterin S-methyltransferase subunit F